MGFFDVRLPEDIERGAIGGPGFKTTVLQLASGAEQRVVNWNRSRAKYNISYGITNKSDLDPVINMFYAMQGMASGFRFKDWGDFQIGDTHSGDTDTAQEIGLGDAVNAAFQIFKRYDVTVTFYDRIVYKIVSGTLRLFVDGAEQIENVQYTANYATGLITFLAGHIPGTKATNSLTLATIVGIASETVTLGSITYEFVSALTGAANEVKIDINANNTANNLAAAVNGSAGAGTIYGTGTVASGSVVAVNVAGEITFTARTGGVGGNAVACSGTLTDPSNVFGNTDGHLNGGTSPAVSVMAEFDVPVRFDSDDLGVNTQVYSNEAVIEIPQINLVELRENS
jgi:uncharacterized protein (TIGR02217 family)